MNVRSSCCKSDGERRSTSVKAKRRGRGRPPGHRVRAVSVSVGGDSVCDGDGDGSGAPNNPFITMLYRSQNSLRLTDEQYALMNGSFTQCIDAARLKFTQSTSLGQTLKELFGMHTTFIY